MNAEPLRSIVVVCARPSALLAVTERSVSEPSRFKSEIVCTRLPSGLTTVASLRRPSNTPSPEPADARVMRQIRTQAGRGAELRYAEAGEKRAVCGYVGRSRGGAAVGFISVPNRILFSDDPLPTEFREMRERYCPGFLTPPPSVRLGT